MSNAPSSASHAIGRHYGLDWLRIAAFAVLILHHVGRAFSPGTWLVKLDSVEWLTAPMLFITPWRLALLFLIAGFASRALLSRRGLGEFTRERTARLLVPLLVAMVLIIPPQSWVSLVVNHGYTASFGQFLATDAFGFTGVDGVTQPGWEHLWFVAYLFGYTMLLVGGAALAGDMLKARLGALVDWMMKGTRLLWLPLLYFIPARVGVAFTLGETHGLFDDWLSDVIYLPCFLAGFAMAGAKDLWPAVARCWKPALAVGLVAYVALLAVELTYPEGTIMPHIPAALDRVAMAAMMWGMVLATLQLANTFLNRDHKWRATMSEAIFPFYIIHQTIIVVLGYALMGSGLPTGASFAIILCGTIAGCWLFYRLGDLIPAIRPLIGLKARKRREPAPVPATA